MLRILFILVLGVHGLIHFMGVTKAFANSGPIKIAVGKAEGIAWLASGLLFLAALTGYLLRSDWWWKLAIPAVVLSQVVIILAWQVAKFGTIANVIVLIVLIPTIAQWNLFREARASFRNGPTNLPEQIDIVQEGDLEGLPHCVQRWLKRAEVVGKERIKTAHVVQKGQMKIAPDKDWTAFEAEQYIRTANPEFLWLAKVGGNSPLRFTGVDRLQGGKGKMRIKVLGIIPAVDSQGPEIDQGSLVRYLAEIIWYPSAALEDELEWKSIGEHSAEATITVNDLQVSGTFTFNMEGDPIGFEAERYYTGTDGKAELKPWRVNIGIDSFRKINGYRIPTDGALTWELDNGDFHWLKLHIEDARYNIVL